MSGERVNLFRAFLHPFQYLKSRRPALENPPEVQASVPPQDETPEIVEAELVVEESDLEKPPVILEEVVSTTRRSKNKILTNIPILLAGSSFFIASVTAFRVLFLGSVLSQNNVPITIPLPPVPPQGFDLSSDITNSTEEREAEHVNLLKSYDAINEFSDHLALLANYGKEAVAIVYSDPRYLQGGGSGFIYSSNGIIITNHHVVIDSFKRTGEIVSDDDVAVMLYDGTVTAGKVIARDPFNDLAAIKVPLENLSILKLSTEEPKSGELVMAIGHPNGLGWSTSIGIVSGTNRFLPWGTEMTQTDAAINSGNSGGPLLNMKGEVISLNSSKWPSYESQNLGFSIPAHTIQGFVNNRIGK